MQKLVFATHNQHKAQEVQQMLPGFKILTLTDIGFHDEIEETGLSFHENAEIKTDAIKASTDFPVFSDDSGLVIPALNNEPGIYSARYAGTGNSKDNINKVLAKLENSDDREAYFQAVICLFMNGEKHFFEGKTHGMILRKIQGEGGFGYDPVFQPQGYSLSFAEMDPEEKNRISHRGKAIAQMKKFLKENGSKIFD